MTELVQFTEEQHYSLIAMDDGKANALSFEMLDAINATLDRAKEVGKPVIIRGRPGKFSAGFDLTVMNQGGDDVIRILREGAGLSLRLLGFESPVILAVSGHALAMGGLRLLSADYRIGIEGNYKIGLNEVAIGMTLPYFGVELARRRLASNCVDRAVGLAQLFDAPAAVKAGFLDEAVAEDALMPRAAAVAEQLSMLDDEAHRNTKLRVREEFLPALRAAIDREFPA